MRQEVAKPIEITVSHTYDDCKCGISRLVAAHVQWKQYSVAVPTCRAVYGNRPVKDAMEAITEFTGMEIVEQAEAVSLVKSYSMSSNEYELLDELEVVSTAGWGRVYYLKRDVLKACLKEAAPKCFSCGRRKCLEQGHDWPLRWTHMHPSRLIEEKGYVYLLIHDSTQLLKVGYSETPAKRIQSHRAALPGGLRCIGVIAGGKYLEKTIHEELREWLAPGHCEWFYFSSAVEKYVNMLLSHRAMQANEHQNLVTK